MELAAIMQLTEEGESDFEKSTRLIDNLPEFVWVPEFVSATGSWFYEREGGRDPNDIDVLVRANADERGRFSVTLGSDLRLKLDRVLQARTGLASEHWHGEPHGPNWRHQPLYDLVLRPRKPEVREIDEADFAREFYKERPIPESEQRRVAIFEKQEDEQIVGGVVYAPDEEDAQGDSASAEEIRKAAYGWMERRQEFMAFHDGTPIRAKVLESYIAPVNFHMETELVKKGSWVLITRVLDKSIWAKIKSGEITGYSMAGRAKSE